MDGSEVIERDELIIQPPPAAIADQVAIDAHSRIVYALRNTAGNPLFASWIEKNKRLGIVLTIKTCDVDELSKLRASGLRAEDELDEDQKFRNRAIGIITKAAQYECSDIHFMIRGTYTEVQFVIDGGLRVYEKISQEDGTKLVRSIYQGVAKTRDKSFQPLDFQNAQIAGDLLPASAGLSSVRIIRGPSYPQDRDGAFMTLRLQYNPAMKRTSEEKLPVLPLPRKPEGKFRLASMGYSNNQVDKLMRLIDAPNGIVIFTGPTGSGKTTAMYECLQETARQKPYRRLVTAEDPVENPMEWGVQLTITGGKNDKENGELFAERIRVMLRMAPNIILLGELRGPDVASAALEAAVTGHSVLTTLHVTDPFLFVERLELMDSVRLNRKVFCDHKIIRGIVSQRLVPKLCPHCSIPLELAKNRLGEQRIKILETWGALDKVRLKGDGCDACRMYGTMGRFAVPEVIVTDAELMSDFIHKGSDTARRNYRAKNSSDKSMLELAINYVLEGEVDPFDVEDKVDLLEPKGEI